MVTPKESSTFGAIKTRDEVPRGNAVLTHAAKPTEVKEKRVKVGPFYSPTTQRTSRTLEKQKKKKRRKEKNGLPVEKLSPEKEPA
jgi:hypothetical protein